LGGESFCGNVEAQGDAVLIVRDEGLPVFVVHVSFLKRGELKICGIAMSG
jgi:hypothetical protein